MGLVGASEDGDEGRVFTSTGEDGHNPFASAADGVDDAEGGGALLDDGWAEGEVVAEGACV